MGATWAGRSAGFSDPATSLVAITPNDSTDLVGGIVRSLYIAVAGDLAVIAADDSAAVTLTAVAAGFVPVAVRRVLSTGTTATGIVGMR